jgi:hypothetical protein
VSRDEFSLTVKLVEDKLIVVNVWTGTTSEFYLPDCKDSQLSAFLAQQSNELAAELSKTRPWRYYVKR